MKNQSLLAMAALSASIFLSSCSSSGSGKDTYKTIPLKEYKYAPAPVSSGTEIEILAFSGGKDIENRNVYYSQFIGKEKSTGDTVRILAAWITVPQETGNAPVLTAADLFDGQKGVHDATFVIPDDNQRTMMNMAVGLHGANVDTAQINKAVNDAAAPTSDFVILQDDVPLFKGNYKTAIGLLNFKQQPW
jgi:hypothetical protein